MKSFLVIGLGRFGSYLAKNLAALGNEVMAIDRDEEKVLQITPFVTAAQVGDCQEEGAMEHLGVTNFDVCFVCINDDFQGSLEVTWALKEQGARYVVARADRERQIKFLKRIGADQVIHTEKDMAGRTAVKYSAPNAFDYIELTPEYVILEIETPASWVGHTVAQVGVRAKYQVNVIGVKHDEHITPLVDPDYLFLAGEHLIVAGSKRDGLRLLRSK